MPRTQHFYFETSAVNYLFDNAFNDERFSSLSTRRLQLIKNRQWQISSIVLWEMFLTRNDTRRHNLLDFSRCLFYEKLMPSPEELLIGYITKGCPENESRFPLESKALFSDYWYKACNDFDFGFTVEKQQIEEVSAHLRSVNQVFDKFYSGYELKDLCVYTETEDKIYAMSLKAMQKRLLDMYRKSPNEDEVHFINITLQLTMLLLCYGIGIDFQLLESFWNKDGKTEPLQRLELTIERYPDLFFRGPIANMAKMILLQTERTPGRGMYFDSMHAVYTTYSDLFVTNDKHFLLFKEENDIDFNMKKIIDVKDLRFSVPIE